MNPDINTTGTFRTPLGAALLTGAVSSLLVLMPTMLSIRSRTEYYLLCNALSYLVLLAAPMIVMRRCANVPFSLIATIVISVVDFLTILILWYAAQFIPFPVTQWLAKWNFWLGHGQRMIAGILLAVALARLYGVQLSVRKTAAAGIAAVLPFYVPYFILQFSGGWRNQDVRAEVIAFWGLSIVLARVAQAAIIALFIEKALSMPAQAKACAT